MNPLRRAPWAIFLTPCILTLAAAVALAAPPKKGATYSGTITQHNKGFTSTWPITFKVSKDGKKVGSFAFKSGFPVYCQGGGFGSPQSKSTGISKKGTFKVKLTLYFAPAHQKQGFLIVSGKFGAHRRASGSVTTDFTISTFPKSCNGSAKYSAHA